MKDLLKEAIADAKTVRETALQNAKLALEEAFAPRLQSIISAQLQNEEEEMEDSDVDVEAETETHEAPEMETEAAEEETPEVADVDVEDAEEEEDMDFDFEDEDEEEDVDLEEIIRELESEEELEELDSSDIGDAENKEPSADASDTADAGEIDLFELEDEDKEMKEGEDMADEEEVDLDEVIKSLREEDEEEVEDTSKEDELEEAYNVIRFLKDKINEVNLLNAKLLYSNKLFKSYDLNENQKMKVIETFDRAVSLREVKLVFSTLAESFKAPVAKKKMVKESFASKPVASTKPKTENVLTEGNELAARFKKLAGLI